jgi:flagellar assembly protein FliH
MKIKPVYRTPTIIPITDTVAIGNTVAIPRDPNAPAEDTEIIAAEARRSESEIQEAIDKGINEGIDRLLSGMRARTQEESDRLLRIAKESADQLEADARAAVAATMELAQRDAEQMKAKALEDGYAEGYATAKEEILSKYNKYVDAAAKLLADINSRKDAYFTSYEAELRATVYVIAEKIIKSELQTHPEVIENIISDAAKRYRNTKYLKIALPDNSESRKLRTDATFVKQLIPFIEHIDIQILEDAPEGTVILDDEDEVTDASIPTQLDFLKEILRNTRAKAQS